TFDGSAETDGHFWIVGAVGTDNVTGGAQRDIFHMEGGASNDTVNGGGGDDSIYLGNSLGASSHIDGGAGDDFVDISGSYGSIGTPVTLTGSIMTSVEHLYLEGTFFNYFFNTDGTLTPAHEMFIDAGAVTTGTVVFDASAETGTLVFIGSHGSGSTFTGGSGEDDFKMGLTTASTVDGGDGNDTFEYSDTFNSNAHIQGRAGSDTLSLDGNFTSLTIDASNVSGIETLTLGNGHEFEGVSIVGDLTGEAGTLTVDASAAFDLGLDLSAATSSNYDVTGS